MPAYDFKTQTVEIEVIIIVGGLSASKLLLDELKRRNKEIIDATPDGEKPKLMTETSLAKEMGIHKQEFNNLARGLGKGIGASKINSLVRYFVKRYGEEGRELAQRSLGVYGE